MKTNKIIFGMVFAFSVFAISSCSDITKASNLADDALDALNDIKIDMNSCNASGVVYGVAGYDENKHEFETCNTIKNELKLQVQELQKEIEDEKEYYIDYVNNKVVAGKWDSVNSVWIAGTSKLDEKEIETRTNELETISNKIIDLKGKTVSADTMLSITKSIE